MGFPQQSLFTVLEVSVKWGCTQAQILDWAMPESLRALVGEMQDWFIANSAAGEAPDESTIRKRISAVWRELNQP